MNSDNLERRVRKRPTVVFDRAKEELLEQQVDALRGKLYAAIAARYHGPHNEGCTWPELQKGIRDGIGGDVMLEIQQLVKENPGADMPMSKYFHHSVRKFIMEYRAPEQQSQQPPNTTL